MMDNLLKISFLISVIGIIGFLFYINLTDIKEFDISKLDQSKTPNAKIIGEIINAKYSEKVSTITIKQDCTIDIISFDNLSDAKMKKGDLIEVIGKKEKQNDEYVIYADEIILKKR
jgi:hypothetical protein